MGNRMFLIAREGGREVLWLSAGENLCATSSTFAGRRHMIGKVVTGCVAILPYHTATQDRGSECRDFGFISRIVTALMLTGRGKVRSPVKIRRLMSKPLNATTNIRRDCFPKLISNESI